MSEATSGTPLERLRELEQSADPQDNEDEILDLCESEGQTDAGLSALVENFSASTSAVVTRALSFVLAQRAWKVTPTNAGIVYRHMELLTQREDATTLLNTLTAIQRQCIQGQPWPPGRVPPTLFPFLAHSATQSEVVRANVDRVLDCLRDNGQLLSALTPEQVLRMKRILLPRS